MRKNHADMDGPEGAGRGAVRRARRRAWTSAGDARARPQPTPAAAPAEPTPPSSSLLATPWFCRRSETAPGCAPQPWRSKCRGGAVWNASVALCAAVDVTGRVYQPTVQLGLANRNKLRLQLPLLCRSDAVGPWREVAPRRRVTHVVGTSRYSVSFCWLCRLTEELNKKKVILLRDTHVGRVTRVGFCCRILLNFAFAANYSSNMHINYKTF